MPQRKNKIKAQAMMKACDLGVQAAVNNNFDNSTNYLMMVYDETGIKYYSLSGTYFHAIGAMGMLKKQFQRELG